ncbi:MAG: competence protein CoiA [Bacteroidales bacterium]|nr:competence protein CoiA [Bacteroidales bacterium]
MKALLYEYAENEQGVFTHIDEAYKGHCYRCIECGEPLIIKEGSKKRKHFAHKNNSNCNGESYIHKIWKKRIKDIFYSNSPFIIKYFVGTPCKEETTCLIKKTKPDLRCYKSYLKERDLKQEYDTCEEEVEYKGFVGDLVLSDSKNPDKEPLFIEIDYTHPCDEEKIASRIRIIEFKVEDDREKPINLFEQGELTLKFGRDFGNPYDMKDLLDVRFYNFDRLLYPTIGMYSFVRNNNGLIEMQYSTGCTCKEKPQKSENATFEIAIADDIVNSRGNNYYIEAIMALAALNEHIIHDCRLCAIKVFKDISYRKCPIMTEKGFASAQQCRRYQIRSDVRKVADRLKGVPYTILTSE